MDPLTDAPAPITDQQRKESGIDAKPVRTGEREVKSENSKDND